MIKRDPANVYRHELKQDFRESKCESVDDFLDVLFGSHNNDYHTEYVVKRKFFEKPKQTIIHRLNTLWVVPFFFIFVAPVRYILFGEARVNGDSKLGDVIRFLIGNLK